MAKVQGKKAAAAGKSAVKKVAMRVKNVAVAAKKKAASKKPPAPSKAAGKKPAPAKAAKPAGKAVAKVKAAAKAASKTVSKATKKVAKKAVAKVAPKKPVKPVKPLRAIKAVKPSTKTAPKAAPKPAPKLAAKPAKTTAKPALKAAAKPAAKPAPAAAAKPVAKAAAVPAKTAAKPAAPAKQATKSAAPVSAAPAAAPVAKPVPEPEKKRGRRARPRIISSGAPAAAWLTTEKPRPASFIPAPARAEAPSAIAAPPASSDRLLRPDDVDHPAVRTVPVRIDVEQGAGRFYVIANPIEVTVRVGEGIEWDFRYIGGADVTADEIVIEFEKPSPFAQATFRTRKPGGARPHRQLSNGALPAAAGKRIEYTVRAMTMFKTEMASTKIWVNVTP